ADQLADGISHGGEFFLVFCHHIPLHHLLLIMEIKGACQKFPALFFHFLQGKFKKFPVVCLEFHSPLFFQDLLVAGEEFPGGKAALRMARLGPWIGKIQIDLLHLSFAEDQRQLSCVHSHKQQIQQIVPFFVHLFSFLDCPEKHAVIHFYSYIIDVRVQPC